MQTVSKARAELRQNDIISSQKSVFKSHLEDSGIFSGFLKAKKSLEQIRLNVNKSVVSKSKEKKSSQNDTINSDKKLRNLDRQIEKLEINLSAPKPPPPPPLVISSLLEPIDMKKKAIETKPLVVDPQQVLMDSIRNFKGFKPKEISLDSTLLNENSQTSTLSKENSQASILSQEIKPDFQTELKNVITERRKFLSNKKFSLSNN